MPRAYKTVTERVEIRLPRGADIDPLTLGEAVLAAHDGRWAEPTDRSNIYATCSAVRIVIRVSRREAV